MRLRLLQFNILADGLAQSGSFAFFSSNDASLNAESTSEESNESGLLYPARMLDWSYRKPLILAEILEAGPETDFIALAEANHFDELLDALSPLGYSGFFAPKPYSEAGDGCALFWRSTRWTPLLAPSATQLDSGKANQLLLSGIFADHKTGQKGLIATSHYKAKTGAENDATRLRHANETLNLMRTLLEPYATSETIPVVFMGDLNTTPNSEAVKTLSSKFDSAVPFPQDQTGFYTTWKTRIDATGKKTTVKRTIDYTFLSDSARLLGEGSGTKQWKVLKRWVPFTDDEVGERGLPSDRYPSDHLAGCFDVLWIG